MVRKAPVWQRRMMVWLKADVGRNRALERLLELQETGAPVHTWPL
jgi:hypothetical protein